MQNNVSKEDFIKLGWVLTPESLVPKSTEAGEWHFTMDANHVYNGMSLGMLYNPADKTIYIKTRPLKWAVINSIKIDGIEEFKYLSSKIIVFGVTLDSIPDISN